MAEGTEPIRQDIDSIRDSMTDKMEQIETKVRGTVEQVRDTVETTVDSVKRSFDLKQQVEERPWMAMGVAMLAGYTLGSMGGNGHDQPLPVHRRGEPMRYYYQDNRFQEQHGQQEQREAGSEQWNRYTPQAGAYQGMAERQSHRQPGMMSEIMGQFSGELNTITTAAVAAAVSMLRDMIKQNLPQFNDEYERVRRERELQGGETHTSNVTHDEGPQPYDRPIERQNELGGSYSGTTGSQSSTPASQIGTTGSQSGMADKDYSSSSSYQGKGSSI